MASSKPEPPRSSASREEIANTVTHGLGLFAAILGSVILIPLSALRGDVWQTAGAAIFGTGLLVLYATSTLYHAVSHQPVKARLKICDHCAIYILIAATYTPFTLVGLRGAWGWTLFGSIWGLAFCGVVFKLFFTGRFRFASTCLYLAMGWLVVIAVDPLVDALARSSLSWLVIGGLAYSAGTWFYLRPRRYAHAIWHLFVLLGSVCHYLAVFTHVVPMPPS
jgi:hemolysin III